VCDYRGAIYANNEKMYQMSRRKLHFSVPSVNISGSGEKLTQVFNEILFVFFFPDIYCRLTQIREFFSSTYLILNITSVLGQN
jgi:hypothetical protein